MWLTDYCLNLSATFVDRDEPTATFWAVDPIYTQLSWASSITQKAQFPNQKLPFKEERHHPSLELRMGDAIHTNGNRGWYFDRLTGTGTSIHDHLC